MKNQIPVIDLFAGAGGLSEGFFAYKYRNRKVFKIGLSVEKDPSAVKTLELRSFFRQFPEGQVCGQYYEYLKGAIDRDEFFKTPGLQTQINAAREEICDLELGLDNKEIHQRIKRLVDKETPWVLLGGPPCQAYSIAARAKKSKPYDKRHYLYEEYLKVIGEFQPTVFLLENVKGILSSRTESEYLYGRIENDLQAPHLAINQTTGKYGKCKYQLYSFTKEARQQSLFDNDYKLRPKDFIVSSEEHGVPQKRHRVFILGIKDGLDVCPDILNNCDQPVPVSSAIGDLPELRSSLSSKIDSYESWCSAVRGILEYPGFSNGAFKDLKLKNDIIYSLKRIKHNLPTGENFCSIKGQRKRFPFNSGWFIDNKLDGFCNHKTRGQMASDLHRYFFSSCYAKIYGRSPKLADMPDFLLPKHKSAHKGTKEPMFTDRFKVQVSNQPASTIVSHISKDGHYYIHPDPLQCRSFTVREAARIQTFPDNYFFEGSRTAQYIQVGNAVPPLLSHQLAGIIYKVLLKAKLA
jgi:DNA (cytosine-5)-methyltransferase 1